MHINKFKKDKGNKYIVYIDDEEYKLYDDIIVKYNLITNKDITKKELDIILNENNEYVSYYESIRYISRKIRSEFEIREYLKKKNIDISIIDKTIFRLKEKNFINDEVFVKTYINDALNLSYKGYIRIKKELLKHEIDETIIDSYLNSIDEDTWIDRINKYIEKKIKVNHSSREIFKRKVSNELYNLGYDLSMIKSCVNQITLDDHEQLNKDYIKIKNKLVNKYDCNQLKYKIKEKLMQKGYSIDSIEGVLNEE